MTLLGPEEGIPRQFHPPHPHPCPICALSENTGETCHEHAQEAGSGWGPKTPVPTWLPLLLPLSVQPHSFPSHLLGAQFLSPRTLENASHPGVAPAFWACVTSLPAHLPVVFPSPVLDSSL